MHVLRFIKHTHTMTYSVTYTNHNGQTAEIIVRAQNEAEAIANAKSMRWTGSDFRNPVQVSDRLYSRVGLDNPHRAIRGRNNRKF